MLKHIKERGKKKIWPSRYRSKACGRNSVKTARLYKSWSVWYAYKFGTPDPTVIFFQCSKEVNKHE